jgi:hypothetical protein
VPSCSVLGCHHQEQLRQRVGFPADSDLPFGHGLEQGGLYFGRRAVDFIGEDQVMEQRALLKMEAALLRTVDLGAGEVGRKQVGRELDAVEIAFDALAEHFDGPGLGQPGRAFHQQVPVGQEGDQQAVDQGFLADDVAADIVFQCL